MREIKEGHGLTDVSCPHGSRWIWWPGLTGRGAWMQVVAASNCDCGDPPKPFNSYRQWACGCLTWKQESAFFIKPCRENCKVLKVAIEESKKRGNILTIQRRGEQ